MTSKFSFGMIFGGDILLKEDYPVLFHVACDRDEQWHNLWTGLIVAFIVTQDSLER